MHGETLKVLAMPDVRERLEKLGAAPTPMTQAAFEKYLDEETRAAAQLVKSAGIRVERMTEVVRAGSCRRRSRLRCR